ncbi:MAG: hypothetical protein KDA85_12035 [Planctomycetaceae bacterium]|nr:hypothetical protein [Planctomycetaceae bacterium]
MPTESPRPSRKGPLLDREEYVEQEYFFRIYRERLQDGVPSQEILKTVNEEILSTTRLPMAIDFMRSEILHNGRVSDAMTRLPHYFTPFQAYVMTRADAEEARFEQLTALLILEREAHYRAHEPVPAGLFVYQLECIARNRLGYGDGLQAMSLDPMYSDAWTDWIQRIRFQLGTTELADLIFRASQHVHTLRQKRTTSSAPPVRTLSPPDEPSPDEPSPTSASLSADRQPGNPLPGTEPAVQTLFGEQEGRIARANIGRDPFYFFAALQRQLDYPAVPRAASEKDIEQVPPAVEARLQKIEQRLKLVELEQKGGIDLTKFYRDNREQLKPLEDL